MHQISFQSPFYFGDLVEYQHPDYGSGRGRVIDIVLSDNAMVYYTLQCEDGVSRSGIYPDEMRLADQPPQSSA
jgi:hypothetical protein